MGAKFNLAAVLVIVAAASLGIQNALAKQGDSGSYDAGFKPGCSDAKLPINQRYINMPGKGASFHSQKFMDGYTQGFEACKFESNGTASSSSSSASGGDGSASSSSSSSSSNGPVIINNFR
jgi:hypothetical protein